MTRAKAQNNWIYCNMIRAKAQITGFSWPTAFLEGEIVAKQVSTIFILLWWI